MSVTNNTGPQSPAEMTKAERRLSLKLSRFGVMSKSVTKEMVREALTNLALDDTTVEELESHRRLLLQELQTTIDTLHLNEVHLIPPP